MKIAVLGAGAGGHAMAAELTLQGHAVALFSRNPEKIKNIQERGGIELHGAVLGDRFIPFTNVTADVAEAVRDADLVVLPLPGIFQEEYLRECLPYVKAGQTVWLAPGTGGSLIGHRILVELGKANEITLAETVTLPYAVRMSGPARAGAIARFKPACAAFPAKRNAEVFGLLRQFYDLPRIAENVLETCLSNPNCLIHPLPGLLNYGWIETRNREFSVYAEGMTPTVVKFVYALDCERVQVMQAAGLKALDMDELYTEFQTGPIWRELMGVGKAEKFEERFFTEDVPVGLVTVASVGAQFGVRTPLADGAIAFSNVLCDTDFRRIGRTAEKLGVAGMNAAQLKNFLYDGA